MSIKNDTLVNQNIDFDQVYTTFGTYNLSKNNSKKFNKKTFFLFLKM